MTFDVMLELMFVVSCLYWCNGAHAHARRCPAAPGSCGCCLDLNRGRGAPLCFSTCPGHPASSLAPLPLFFHDPVISSPLLIPNVALSVGFFLPSAAL